jgi:5'-nucleotidase
MKILITNDDGILSPVLPLLIRWARKHGEVTALAPKVEQSGKSHSIEFHRQIEIKEISLAQDVCVYSVDSSPADCVRFSVLGLKQKYDLVLSGINRGYNLGDDIVYSGTVGAIFEAARLGMRGLAVSTDPDNLLASLSVLDALWE